MANIFEQLYRDPNTLNYGQLTTKIDENFNIIPSYINISNWDVLEDGSTNDQSKIQIALDYCRTNNLTLVFNNKEYRVNSTLNIADVNIIWNYAIFKSPNINLFEFKGSAGTEYTTTGNSYKGTNHIQITNGTFLNTINSGDYIKIINNTETQSTTETDVNYQAEIHRIQSKDAAGLYICENLHEDYLTSNNSRIQKIITATAKWVGSPKIIFDIPTASTTNGFGLEIHYASDINFSVIVENSDIGISIEDSYNCTIDGRVFNGFDKLTGSDILGYGISYGSCSKLKIYGNYIGCKHAVTAGGAASGSGVNYDIQIIGVVGTGYLNNPVFDTHDISGDVTYVNCKAIQIVNILSGYNIVEYNAETTYNQSSTDRVRGSNGALYECKVNGTTGVDPTTSQATNWKLWHSDGVGWVVEGYTSTLINCEAVGCNIAIQATSETPQGIILRDFKVTNCSFGMALQNDKVNVLDINGFWLDNDYRSSRQSMAFLINCDVDRWYFNNIRTRNSGLIELNQATTPISLKINNVKCYNDVAETQIELVTDNNTNTTITLFNTDFENINYTP